MQAFRLGPALPDPLPVPGGVGTSGAARRLDMRMHACRTRAEASPAARMPDGAPSWVDQDFEEPDFG